MKKILEFIWQNKYIFLTAIIIAAIIIVSRGLKEEKKTTVPPKQASYNDLTPGISTEADVKNKLGEPVKTTTAADKTVLDYKSTSPVRFNNAVIQNGKVAFIKEIIAYTDNKKAQDLIDLYGISPYTLYDQKDPNSYYYLHPYPDVGVAYLGHPNGNLLEIWYFQPTTLNDFIKNWASSYSRTKSTEQIQ